MCLSVFFKCCLKSHTTFLAFAFLLYFGVNHCRDLTKAFKCVALWHLNPTVEKEITKLTRFCLPQS